MTDKLSYHVTWTLSVLAFCLFVSCAEVAAPPGGEEDRQAPLVINTLPVNGAINVEPSRQITFWFSEGITRPTGSKPVYITPRQIVAPSLKWKTDRLVVELAEEFLPNQTYVVTLSSDVADWRRNKMDSTVTVAFSTGERIDTGSVSGIVTSKGTPKGGILVGLYGLTDANEAIQYDSVYPNYLTQSSTDGSFRFKYLPDSKFKLVAFEEIVRNERFNPTEEPFAVSDRPVNVGGALSLNNLNLDLSEPVDAETKIVSVILTSDRLLRVRTNIEIPLEHLNKNLSRVHVTKKADSSQLVEVLALLESHLETSSVLTFSVSGIDTGKYTIVLPYDTDKKDLVFDEAVIPKMEDKSAPTILEYKPENKAHFLDKIELGIVFSEPIDKSKMSIGTYALWGEQEQPVDFATDWKDDFHLTFKCDDLKEGTKYKMTLAEFEIADLAGNLLGDSIRTFEFSVLDSDSLGSVSGIIEVYIPEQISAARKLNFEEIKGKQTVDFTVNGNSFNAILPAGKYLVSGFLDKNNNGRRDHGSVQPYSFAETFTKFPDTISVRARFETSGIIITFK